MPLILAAHVPVQVVNATCTLDGDSVDALCRLVMRVTHGEAVTVARLAGTYVTPVVRILFILALAFLAVRLARRFIKRTINQFASDGIQTLGWLRGKAPLADTGPLDLQRAALRTETIGGVLRSVATFGIWTLAVVTILGEFIDIGPLIAGAGIVGVALGFGAQNLVKDFLSGIFIILEDQYGIGDVIDVGEATGVVETITLRTTRLRDVEGTVWHVPNGEIRRVGNKSQQWARSLLDVGVAYDTPVDKAIAVLKTTADALWQDPEWCAFILEEPEIWGLERFDADALTIRMVLKVQPAKQWAVNRELRARIKAAFDEAAIEIPFPQRSLWIREAPDSRSAAVAGKGVTQSKQSGNDGATTRA
jgi:small-conductance mechanosensitive channel